MTTVADIRDRIKDDLVLTDTEQYDTQLVSAIQSALRELRGKRYWFLEAYATLTSTASSEEIDIRAQVPDFGVIKSIDLIFTNTRYVDRYGFNLVSFDKLRADYWTVSPLRTQRPRACAELNGTLYLSDTWGAALSLPMVYYKQDATLPAASETSVWFDDGQDLVRAKAQYIFKRDSQGMTLQEADADMVVMAEKRLDEAHLAKKVGRA